MAKKKRQRISYVLPLASTPGGHRLGVNGLSFDQDRDILYTGGRDGVICAWNLDLKAEYVQQEDKSLPSTRNTASFRQQVQAHTHWVNDLVLVKNNLAVVSASSDASVKLWRPHSAEASSAYTIGSHSDYIKCLSSPDRHSNWVASGGLDHRIKLWDLSGGGEILEMDIKKADNTKVDKSSIYALKANRNMIATGGPESVVRVWDVKSGKGITKLVGHTDNIRDILMSDDGDTVLTASSDQTVKVWSITAGRCLHTLTMHNDSVWCMYSDDPTLSVFYSGDKSGLVAKTDTRRAMEIEEGVSVAVCQEHDGISRLAIAGESIWTATSSSSINRWKDVDTELEVETPPPSPRHERRHSAVSRNMHSPTPSTSGQTLSISRPAPAPAPVTNGVHDRRIPHNSILRLSNTAIHPGRKQPERNYSVTNLRKASEAILDAGLIFITPIRGHPEETIEGQNGLTKHVILNDKKRVLTIDTAGEVVLWDLLECVPIKAFGRRHLDEVVPEVNTQENVANWCTVDTKTGKLTVMLEELYCFDAELYADDLNIKENIEFREDQRINLGKWVLRNLFGGLLDEELKRDETYRRSFRTHTQPVQVQPSGSIQRLGAPTRILLPGSLQTTPMVSPGTVLTPRANGRFIPATPGLAIGLATPGGAESTNGYSPLTRPITNSTLPPTIQEDLTPGQAMSPSTVPASNASDLNTDYFSSNRNAERSETPSEANSGQAPAAEPSSALSPTSPTDDKRKSLFGKKFQMTFPKKLGRSSETAKTPSATTVTTTEDKSEDSDRSSDKDGPPAILIEDNFHGVIQRIRQSYIHHAGSLPNEVIPPGITPSLPAETPVLKQPPHTLIIIQEDDPESGGLTDLYRGEIAKLSREADVVEKVAPSWLGELLLRNQIPDKETVKVSFVLHPFEDERHLPPISSPDGNSRLNANRMLRAKKIIAYVAERIDPQPAPPAPIMQMNEDGTTTVINSAPQPPPLRPEEYLELICQGQKVDPNMTLGTLRVHVWRVGGDVVLYYRANGKKEIRLPHPADVATRDEGMGQVVTNA